MAMWREEAEAIMDDFEVMEVAARYSRPLPIDTLASVSVDPAEGVCTGCGEPSADDLCDGCMNARWTAACFDCAGPIEDALARLGSLRCMDCRDVNRVTHIDTLRRAA